MDSMYILAHEFAVDAYHPKSVFARGLTVGPSLPKSSRIILTRMTSLKWMSYGTFFEMNFVLL